MTTLDTYTPPESTNGDNVSPSDILDRPLIVRVRERREDVKTQYKPDGAPGLIVDVVDVLSAGVYRDSLWMNAGLVDPMTPSVGKVIAIVLREKTGASGRNYITLDPAEGEALAQAQAYITRNPDPWQALGTVDTAAPAAPVTPAPAPAPAAPSNPADLAKQLIAAGLDDAAIVAATNLPTNVIAALRNVAPF